MILNDLPRFCIAMFWLAEKYPTTVGGNTVARGLTEEWLHDYFEAIGDLTIEQVESGVKWHYGHNEFFPERPAALRKSIEAMPAPPLQPRPALPTQGNPDEQETPRELVIHNLDKIYRQLNRHFSTTLTAE